MAGKGGALSSKQAASLIALFWALVIGVAMVLVFVGEDKPKNKKPDNEETVTRVTLTALDEYVRKYDPNYSYKVLTDYTVRNQASTSFVINMTSQAWMTGKYFNYFSVKQFRSSVHKYLSTRTVF